MDMKFASLDMNYGLLASLSELEMGPKSRQTPARLLKSRLGH
jgi:hypothetical protein